MYRSGKKLAVLCIGILIFLGMWMILPVHCRASETDTDKKQTQTGKQDDSTQQKTEKSESFCQGGAWIFFILLTQILSLLLPE